MSSSYDHGRSGWTARPPDVFLRLVRKQRKRLAGETPIYRRRRVWGERLGIPTISFFCDVEAGSSTMIYRRGVERGYQCERDRDGSGKKEEKRCHRHQYHRWWNIEREWSVGKTREGRVGRADCVKTLGRNHGDNTFTKLNKLLQTNFNR